jgi:hypothetical protein
MGPSDSVIPVKEAIHILLAIPSGSDTIYMAALFFYW